jgi:hypothetical protein
VVVRCGRAPFCSGQGESTEIYGKGGRVVAAGEQGFRSVSFGSLSWKDVGCMRMIGHLEHLERYRMQATNGIHIHQQLNLLSALQQGSCNSAFIWCWCWYGYL